MNVTEEICTPMSVYEWKPNKSYLMFVVKENAGEQFATLNNQVQKVCENIEDVKNALNVLKNKMGENTGTLQQIGEIVSALDQKKQDLITKNKEVRKAVMKFCQARLSPPLIGQIAAEASLDEPEEYTRETYDEYVERRKCLIDGLNRIPGVYSPIPMGAFYTVAKLPVDDSEKFCAWCLSDFNYEGETVMLAPAAGFYTTPGAGHNEVRLAYVLKKEDLVRALFVLRKALEAYPGRVDD